MQECPDCDIGSEIDILEFKEMAGIPMEHTCVCGFSQNLVIETHSFSGSA